MDNNPNSKASAVHIGNGYFLTAKHTIKSKTPTVTLITSKNKTTSADILWSSLTHDLMLLHVRDMDQIYIDQYNLNCDPLRRGDTLEFIGSTRTLDFISMWGNVAGNAFNAAPLSERLVPVNSSFIPGMSGGAAINARGELKGINIGVLVATSAVTHMGPVPSFTNISYVLEAEDICFLMGKTK